jgi:hypothetical protein
MLVFKLTLPASAIPGDIGVSTSWLPPFYFL